MRKFCTLAARSFRLTALLLLLLGSKSFSQTSNKGRDFWIAYAGHIDQTVSRMTIFLSSDVGTNYQVEFQGKVISSGSIQANVVTPVFINPTIYDAHIATSEQIEINKGIHVTSGDNISVYCIISNNARTAGSMILPTRALGNNYYAFSYMNEGTTIAPSHFTIVGVEDNTNIEIVPTATSIGGTIGNGQNKINVTLNKGDVYQYMAPADVSGSQIRTLGDCKPIAVFSGGSWIAFCEQGNQITNPSQSLPGRPAPSGGDNLYQQLFPASAWGKNYITSPFYNTENGNVDAFRIIVSEDATTLTISGGADLKYLKPFTNPLKKGDIITYYTSQPSIIRADKPIGVAQYQSSQNCNPLNRPNVNVPGDPEMTILNPVEQTLTDIAVFSRLKSVSGVNTAINKYYLNIVLKTADIGGFRLDGQPVSNFKPVDTEYSYANVDVSSSQDQHRLTATGGFNAIAYGYGNFESYAYLAGADVKNLYQNISALNSGNIAVKTGCVAEPVKFVLRLPYITSSIIWDLGEGGGIHTDNAPAFSTEVQDGKTIYIYEYNAGKAIYDAAGKYEVIAVSQNPAPGGCDAQEVVRIEFEVVEPPSAKFSAPMQVCVGADQTFTDASEGHSKNIVKWFWDFGDGTTSTEQNPVHTYTKSGVYTVSLKVEGETGCVVQTSSTIRAIEPPVAGFTVSSPACDSQAVTFNSTSVSAEGKILKWVWNPGDGTELSELTSSAPFEHSYRLPGTYKVSLMVISETSCTSVFEKEMIVYPSPLVDFSLPEICLRDALAKFQNNSRMPDGSAIQSYKWSFGDQNSSAANNTSNLENPGHIYTAAGNYQVSLTVRSASGCEFTRTQTLTVNGADPKASFTVQDPARLCSNRPVVFLNTSSVDFGTIGKVEWYFDLDNSSLVTLTDDDPGPGKQYTYQYPVFYSPATRTVRVKMKAYSGGVCSDEYETTITLMAAPATEFAALPDICQNDPAFKLTQAREIYQQAGTGLYSGPGVDAKGIFDPAVAGPGTHQIDFLFTADNGCTELVSQHITVLPLPAANAGKDTMILSGESVRLRGFGQGVSGLTYKWLPSAGLSADNIPDPIATPSESTTYTLWVSSDKGCTVSDQVFVKVLQIPEVPKAFTPNGDGVNDQWNIRFLEDYPNARLDVYARNGTLVYSAKRYTSGWDGRRGGTDLPVATYYYIIEPGSGRATITGSVTILR